MTRNRGPPGQNLIYSMRVERHTFDRQRVSGWEEHLVRRAQEGQTVALDLLIEMYRPAVMSLAMRLLRDSDDAQDAVQDTFLKACRALKSFDPSRPLLPWLLRICNNCCIDIVRARKQSADSLGEFEHQVADDRVDIEGDLADSVDADLLRAAIRGLPHRYRQILTMRLDNNMEVNEIAESLGKPEGTVKSWLFRARALLRKAMMPDLPQEAHA